MLELKNINQIEPPLLFIIIFWQVVKIKSSYGLIVAINKGHLLNGDITSCGCVQKSRPAKAKEGYLVNNTYIATIRSGKPSKRSTTGIKGVYWSKTKNKYQAAIRCQGINHELGYFNSLAEAVAARVEAEEKYFKPLIDDFNKKRGAE